VVLARRSIVHMCVTPRVDLTTAIFGAVPHVPHAIQSGSVAAFGADASDGVIWLQAVLATVSADMPISEKSVGRCVDTQAAKDVDLAKCLVQLSV
jgi:hypothetical protein